ncbi:MAG: outer membrane beta-barrel protein [bacterium]
MKKVRIYFKVLLVLLLVVISILKYSFAQNYYVYNNIEDKKIDIKAGLWNAKLTGTLFAPSTNFTTDLSNDLGFGNTKTGFYFDFNYKLSNLNTVGLSYFNIEHKAVRTLTRNITLPAEPLDINISSGTTVFSNIRNSAFDLFYKRYFNTEQNYDFYGMVGIRFNDFKADYSTNTLPLASFEGNAPSLFLGLGGKFNIGSNLSAFYEVSGLSVSLNSKSKNKFFQYNLGLGYRFTDNWNLNIGYRYLSTKFEDDFNRNSDLRLQGLNFELNFRF